MCLCLSVQYYALLKVVPPLRPTHHFEVFDDYTIASAVSDHT